MKDLFFSEDLKNIIFLDSTIYLKKEKTLIFGDLHIGIEESLKQKGVEIPFYNLKYLLIKLNNINKILKKNNLETDKIILNGDIKDSLYYLNINTKRELNKFFDILKKMSKNIFVIKGNHDNFLEKYLNFEIRDFFEFEDYLITHGNKKIKTNKTIIINHEHIAINIKDNLYKCFLISPDKKLIILPSFTKTIGSDVFKYNFLSPYTKEKIKKYDLRKWKAIIFEENEFFPFNIKDLEDL